MRARKYFRLCPEAGVLQFQLYEDGSYCTERIIFILRRDISSGNFGSLSLSDELPACELMCTLPVS